MDKPIFRPIDFYFAQDERIEFACKFAKGVVLFCSHGINSQYLISKILLENGADEVWHYDSKLDQRITIRKMNDGKIEMEEKKKFSDINDETFDCILTFEELQFQEKRNELLQTYKKILKNDGTLILSTRNKLSSAEARILPKFDHHKSELDKFCDAMISIRMEIDCKDASSVMILKNAPHTLKMVSGDVWELPYTRQKAAYPLAYVSENKFWPSVRRVDEAFGDRNLICSCNVNQADTFEQKKCA